MLLATLSTNSATATDGIDAEWKTVFLCPCEHNQAAGAVGTQHAPCDVKANIGRESEGRSAKKNTIHTSSKKS